MCVCFVFVRLKRTIGVLTSLLLLIAIQLPHAAHELRTTFRKEAFTELQVVGQFNNGFIVARLGYDDLFIIDQHASNEIYNFETLQRTTVIRTQRMLKPITLEFAPDEEMVRACAVSSRVCI